MLKCCLSFIFFVSLGQLWYGYSQERVISGYVMDDLSKLPLVGVQITQAKTSNTVLTDTQGAFHLTLAPQTNPVSLDIIKEGYAVQFVTLQDTSTVVGIALVPQYQQLGEDIVVIGFGTEDRKVSTAASSLVTSDEINRTVNGRIEQAIQGKAAGVQVSQNSGSPGAPLNVRIRGIGTPNNSDPLYIVDGVRTGGMDFLSPEDIERIDILKDAASAAIYGVAAANGVVLITTKSGASKRNGQVDIAYTGYYAIQELQKKVKLLNAYEYNDLYKLQAPAYATDWQDAVITPAPMTRHHLGIAGRSNATSYSLGGSYYGQNGIVGSEIAPEKSFYDRYTFRSNVQTIIKDRLTIGANISFSSYSRRNLPENNEIIGVVPRLLNFSPSVPIYDEGTSNPYYDPLVASDLNNPVSTILTYEAKWTQFKTFNSAWLGIKIVDGLQLKSTYTIDYSTAQNKSFQPSYFFNRNDQRTVNSLTEQRYEWYNWTWQSVLSYQKVVKEDHDINILLGTEMYEAHYKFLSASNTNIEVNDFNAANLGLANGGKEEDATGYNSHSSSLLSFFGRVSYKYKERYSFTTNFRVDGSSRFGPKNRFGFFPSASAAWVISEEPFFRKMKKLSAVLNYVKLRFSWGMNGNQEIGNYRYLSQVSIGSRYIYGKNDVSSTGATIDRVTNPELHWEVSTQYDVGLELGLLNNRVSVVIDYYSKLTDGVLVSVPIPGQVGLPPSEVNAGNVLNQGVELEISFKNKATTSCGYNLQLNATYNRNEVTSLGKEGNPINAGSTFHIDGSVSRTQVGLPIASFWGYKTLGVFQNTFEVQEYISDDGTVIQPNAVPGDFKYQDTNGDGVLDEKDKVFLGKPMPDVVLGFSGSVQYKGFDFFLFAQLSLGNSVYRAYTGFKSGPINQPADIIAGRWTGENSTNVSPTISANPTSSLYNNESLRISNFFIEDASFLKVRNIQLGYSLPSKLFKRVPFKKVRIYAAIQNAVTLTAYSGFDPEIGSTGTQLDLGIDKGFYPAARTYTFGIELNF